MIPQVPISAAVSACKRESTLKTTLERILSCTPQPSELLVHLDGDSPTVRSLVSIVAPCARILASQTNIGPGGARNRLTREASSSWIAHFDDDSFPANPDFFATAQTLIATHPDVAVWSATIISHESPPEPGSLWLQGVYPGCGHLMSKTWFSQTSGYIPLPVAYNLEEVDVALQLHAIGARCVQTADLKVCHDHPTPIRETPDTEVLMMINTILFPLLRYPFPLFPQAAFSIFRRAFRLACLPGGLSILTRSAALLPKAISQNLHRRQATPFAPTLSWLLLRRNRVRLK